jgi:predicted transcriptional regulator
MTQSQVNARLPEELAQQLDSISQISGRSKAWHLQKAVEAYVHREAHYLSEIQKGIDSYNAHGGIAHEKVKEQVFALIEKHRFKQSKNAA